MTLAKALGETRGRSKFVSTALETFLAKIKSTAAERHFWARTFVSACCSQEDVMIQIGVQPLSAGFTEGPPPDPAQAVGGHPGPQSRLSDDASGQQQDAALVVSPPPLPFPRVFPGL
jgi:hypothetical protein